MRRVPRVRLPAVTALLLFSFSIAFAAEIFTWTDDSGTTNFSDSLHQVPERYRNQVKTKLLPQDSSSDLKGQRAGEARLEVSPLVKLRPDEDSRPDSDGGQRLHRYEVPFVAVDRSSARRIIIEVTFNDSVTAPMLLDTGSPGLMISSKLAERLGIFGRDESKLYVKAGGIGGEVPAVFAIIDRVQMGGAKDRFVPAVIAPSISPSFEGLIGMDFVSNYSMKVDTLRQVVIFEELPLNPNAPGGRGEGWWRSLYQEVAGTRSKWKEFGLSIEKKINGSPISAGPDFERLKGLKEFSNAQYRASGRLLDTLDHYANEYSVPRPWRAY